MPEPITEEKLEADLHDLALMEEDLAIAEKKLERFFARHREVIETYFELSTAVDRHYVKVETKRRAVNAWKDYFRLKKKAETGWQRGKLRETGGRWRWLDENRGS